jgi:Pyruvate/2-oxoacid:ferredoxin oxidoreductase delta subunit
MLSIVHLIRMENKFFILNANKGGDRMKAPSLPNLENYVPKDTVFVEPAENSHMGLSVPEVVFTYGNKKTHIKKIPYIFPNLIKAIFNAVISYRSLRKNPAQAQKKADKVFFQNLENYARKLGCTNIGYTEVPREYILQNKKILFKYAIVLTMDMNKEKINQAPSINAGKEVWRTYAELGSIVNHLARFMRKRGYKAEAGPAVGGEVNYPLLAQKAGLGYIGKHGMLISQGNGPCQRIAVVYTDIENLPFTDSSDYDWIPSFCEKCNRCVSQCPAQAIYKETKILEDSSHQHIDYTKCAIPFSKSMGCSVCIKECTFFKSDFDKIRKQVI